jgi:hypothetical protein
MRRVTLFSAFTQILPGLFEKQMPNKVQYALTIWHKSCRKYANPATFHHRGDV